MSVDPESDSLTFEVLKKAIDRVKNEQVVPTTLYLHPRDAIAYDVFARSESWEEYRYPIRHRLLDVYRMIRHQRKYYLDFSELWCSVKWTMKIKTKPRLTEAAIQEIEELWEEYDRS